ncbi:alpha/beta hydrolase family protein [Sphingomonas oligophenolica]|uniref:Dienelactone hydrolase n=1 Tax=Sphingomonas oligophenolica TaxID=301154 RepID=A0A502CJ36_9SPHN|nr:dienelactone hydrolase [Sphingomonas oligophenolica]TPG13207.1 dienelactone hydrolase [Sphingomonas oligophenolica]
MVSLSSLRDIVRRVWCLPATGCSSSTFGNRQTSGRIAAAVVACPRPNEIGAVALFQFCRHVRQRSNAKAKFRQEVGGMMGPWIRATLLLGASFFAVSNVEGQLPVDSPELAARGASPVGTQTIILIDPDRADVLEPDGVGGFKHHARKLPIEIWYPAVSAAKDVQQVTYTMPAPFLGNRKRKRVVRLSFPGKAARNAEPAVGHFPLLILSHGYNNRAIGFSDLAENLASKGYVVVAIEHGDVDPVIAGSRRASFTQVWVDRSADQRFVIAEIRRRTASSYKGVFEHIDADKLALAGYSMGGYGAIATAGAGYDPKSSLMAQLPKAMMAGSLEDDDKPVPGLRALILFGPWGGSPATRMWSPAALSKISAPALIIDGDRDDVADYANGVHWLFDRMAQSDRYLLSYREARHNIAMNAAPASVSDDYLYIDKFNEPVWRKDRILAINAHMITAFLDLHLKGISDRAGYLNVPAPIADDGTWLLSEGEVSGDQLAKPTGSSATYWRGFHRRWALGLELAHVSPAKTHGQQTRE